MTIEYSIAGISLKTGERYEAESFYGCGGGIGLDSGSLGAAVMDCRHLVTILPLRSLLGGEGLRWFFGTFVDNVASPLLAWLVLCSMAYGSLVRSGLCKAVSSVFTGAELAYRQRHALYSAFVAMLAFVAVVVMLAFVPHAPLLGLSGSLFPSALVPRWWRCQRLPSSCCLAFTVQLRHIWQHWRFFGSCMLALSWLLRCIRCMSWLFSCIGR